MFDRYQNEASAHFKEHFDLNAHQSRLLNWVTGLSGETGEVSELIKHGIWGGEPIDKMELAKEMGDVLWYLQAIATTEDLKMSDIADLNVSKLRHRHGAHYSADASKHRHDLEKQFEETFLYKCIEARICKRPAPLNVIFVGPDGAGKTTLAKAVAVLLETEGFTYHKCNYEQNDKPELSLQLLGDKMNVIYDRFYYPDDIIYSRIKHEQTSKEPMDWDTDYWKSYNKVRDELCTLNTVIIYTTADLDVLKARSKVWADDYITVDDLSKISKLYDRWIEYMCTLPVLLLKVDTTTGAPEEHVNDITLFIRRAQAYMSGLEPNYFLTEEEAARAEKLDNAAE